MSLSPLRPALCGVVAMLLWIPLGGASTAEAQTGELSSRSLSRQIDALEQERIALELELELVRGRAAELYETV